MIRALSLVVLFAVSAAAYETATSSCDLLYQDTVCIVSDGCPSGCETDSDGDCGLPAADKAKMDADNDSAGNTAAAVLNTCGLKTTESTCTGDCAWGADENGSPYCYPTFAKVSSLMTADGAPAAVINGHYQPLIEDGWFRCFTLDTESTCSANDACDWNGGICSYAIDMMIVRRQNACPDSDYATLVATASGGQTSLSEMYGTAEDADPSIEPADGVSLSGASGIARSALALAVSAAALVALA
jgi:hypothetical protein